MGWGELRALGKVFLQKDPPQTPPQKLLLSERVATFGPSLGMSFNCEWVHVGMY